MKDIYVMKVYHYSCGGTSKKPARYFSSFEKAMDAVHECYLKAGLPRHSHIIIDREGDDRTFWNEKAKIEILLTKENLE
jgi:hypothetical protein